MLQQMNKKLCVALHNIAVLKFFYKQFFYFSLVLLILRITKIQFNKTVI